ncbi:AAA family ATPase [Bradyrhizobium symbiodeficiens]|uniref:ATP-dependent nuclease n=1 Tax=Bradyrhizobium symbiodeficiens TaxID=1404367 RepID=UPI0030CC9E3D
MQIRRLRLRNHKSFRDSGWLNVSRNFTVIVGKNNVGKTALLEAFRLNDLQARPHRSERRAVGVPLEPQTRVDLELALSGKDLKRIQLLKGARISIPVPEGELTGEQRLAFARDIYELPELILYLTTTAGGGFSAIKYPSHQLFERGANSICVETTPDQSLQEIMFDGPGLIDNDSLPSLIHDGQSRDIYVFRAERLSIGRTIASGETILRPDASNLAAVLMALQANAHRFERLNRHISEIFPTITRVSVATVANEFEVRIWSVDIASEREDLAIPLSESGTGVGQVLAILYVAMTIEKGLVVIDEPNTFLHPGAAKKLIQILRQYNNHQYVLATHSADLIATTDPEIIQLITWSDGESSVQEIGSNKLDDLRRMLVEVGASFSDVFGFDRAVWVEGPTEEACFPMILRKLRGATPLGVAFIAVRNTGDFERKIKGDQKKLIWDLYERLSSGFALLPSSVSFSFDREARTQQQIDDLKRQSRDRVHFLPRLTYENYLLRPDAIANVLTAIPREGQGPISAETVQDWLNANGGRFAPDGAWSGDLGSAKWLAEVHSPSLLTELFNELSGVNLEYSKTIHSVLLTEWLLENDPRALDELAAYIETLSPLKASLADGARESRRYPP